MTGRSELRPTTGHVENERADETKVEVVRGGEVVATIYGTREGIQVVINEALIGPQQPPFRFEVTGIKSVVVPLMRTNEQCPWCLGTGTAPTIHAACPVCKAGRPS